MVTLQTIAGMLDGTMNRNDAYIFSMLGRNLERADMTSRIVDVRSAQLLPAETPELRPFESVQWMSVLKSLSGYQMYRLRMRTRVKRTDVLQFLLRDDQFPRSCQFCLMQLERSLNELPRSEGVLEVLARRRALHRARAAGHARPARAARAHRQAAAAHQQRAQHDRRDLLPVARRERRAAHAQPEPARASRSGRARCRSAKRAKA